MSTTMNEAEVSTRNGASRRAVAFVEGLKDGTVKAKGVKAPQALSVQNLSALNISELNPLTPEVISRQATINIGAIGHVAHGKSTLVKAISSKKTETFRTELSLNRTIKLGYANAKIYVKEGVSMELPGNYTSAPSSTPDNFVDDNGQAWKLSRHISFVDCPGHDILMATMLNGAAVMDAAMLVIAGNETCPQPQTSEHLAAVEIMRLQNIILVQNKVDLVKPEVAAENHQQIKTFVSGTVADESPIIPVSAVNNINVDVVCEYIARYIPVPTRNFMGTPRMIIIRSFDVNKPGQDIESLKGGVLGGSILQGVLKIGDEIEVRPGIVTRDADGTMMCTPIYSRVVSLLAEQNKLQYAVPGGLIGVGTAIDPTITKADTLVGQVLGLKGHLPEIYHAVDVSYYLLRRLLGVKVQEGSKQVRVQKLAKGEILMVNIGSTSTGGKVTKVLEDSDGSPMVRIALSKPVCTENGEKIALSRRVDQNWRLIGWGEIKAGKVVSIQQPGGKVSTGDG